MFYFLTQNLTHSNKAYNTSQARPDGALSKLVKCKLSWLMAGGLKLENL